MTSPNGLHPYLQELNLGGDSHCFGPWQADCVTCTTKCGGEGLGRTTGGRGRGKREGEGEGDFVGEEERGSKRLRMSMDVIMMRRKG